MDIVIEAVNKLKEVITHSGCEDGGVVLQVNPDVISCQYEKGACMEACFGGRSGEFTTFNPIRATTKLEFMFGATLDSQETRGAACAIMNVVTKFLCLSRNVRACPAKSHELCVHDLKSRIGSKSVCCLGTMPTIESVFGRFTVSDPVSADIILINGEGSITPEVGDIVKKFINKKTILFIGPSTSGIASLEKIERFCPYGT